MSNSLHGLRIKVLLCIVLFDEPLLRTILVTIVIQDLVDNLVLQLGYIRMLALVIESGITPSCTLHDYTFELASPTAGQLKIITFKGFRIGWFLVNLA